MEKDMQNQEGAGACEMRAPAPASRRPLQGCAAGGGACVQGIHWGLGGPILGLSDYGDVIKGLGGLDVDVLHLLQFPAALATAAARAAQQAADAAAEAAADAAAAAAASLAVAGVQGDHAVPGLQRAHAQGQEVPILEHLGQDAWAAGLQELEDQHQKDH